MSTLPVPTPPDGYFFRVRPGSTYLPINAVSLQLRRRVRWGSVKVDQIQIFEETTAKTERALIREASNLLASLRERQLRKQTAAANTHFYGDHP